MDDLCLEKIIEFRDSANNTFRYLKSKYSTLEDLLNGLIKEKRKINGVCVTDKFRFCEIIIGLNRNISEYKQCDVNNCDSSYLMLLNPKNYLTIKIEEQCYLIGEANKNTLLSDLLNRLMSINENIENYELLNKSNNQVIDIRGLKVIDYIGKELIWRKKEKPIEIKNDVGDIICNIEIKDNETFKDMWNRPNLKDGFFTACLRIHI
jgi:hypothetical protein